MVPIGFALLWFSTGCLVQVGGIAVDFAHRPGGYDRSRSPVSTKHGREGGALSPDTGVVHFLFLVNGSLPHAALWRRFFARAPAGTWRAWVHCADAQACRDSGVAAELPGLTVVPTVPSSYCTDLVTPTVQLLKSALASRTEVAHGALEKFALVSDSTVPVKSFGYVFRELTSSPESDFCIAPPSDWRGAHVDTKKLFLVKHSQWVVLNRDHAHSLVRRWAPPKQWDTFQGWWNVPLRGSHGSRSPQRLISATRFMANQNGHYACTDEQAVFATLFGAFEGTRRSFAGLGDVDRTAASVQGRCRTFVVFRNTKDLGNLTDNVMGVARHDPSTQLLQQPDPSHPVELSCPGRQTVAALRASPFLFARKFSSGKACGSSSALLELTDDHSEAEERSGAALADRRGASVAERGSKAGAAALAPRLVPFILMFFCWGRARFEE
eukprot:TRINITY_DN9566_c0_g1_i1.p1 TRINITY_DN9566_c0_g1~~TRINITY_DN9566_c0_g1_i1.p1  ORF type:complete len:439 (+),score=84.91 TRINITY_DN9566_c0_g1_i1:204-1520(+)